MFDIPVVALPDPVTAVALVLLAVGVVGSVVPGLPAGLLSLAGVYVYWLFGPTPGLSLLALVALTAVGLLAVVVDHVAGPLAAKAGGASTKTTVVAGLVGFALLFVAGPVGLLAGVVGTVLVLELRAGATIDEGGKAAVVAAVGMLASAGVVLLLTLSMLVGFVAAIPWP